MASFDNFKDWFKIGSSALAIALASEAYAAGPSKPKATPTKELAITSEYKGEEAKKTAQGSKLKYSDLVTHAAFHGDNPSTPDYMTFDNNGTPIASLRNIPGSIPEYFITPTPVPAIKPAAKAKPAAKPAPKLERLTDLTEVYNILRAANVPDDIQERTEYLVHIDHGKPGRDPSDIMVVYSVDNKEIHRFNLVVPAAPAPTKDDFSLEGIVSPTATPIPTQIQTKTSTPTPQPTKKPSFLSGVPIVVSGRGSIAPYQQQVSGTLWDGSGWRDVHTGARLNVRELGLRTEGLTRYLNGAFLVDGNIVRASISGIENGTHYGGEAIGRILAEFGYNFGKFAIGPAGGFSRNRFVFPGGTLTQTRSGAGLEAMVGATAKDGSLTGGVRGRRLNYSAAAVHNDGFASRDQDVLVAGFLNVPKIGDWSVYAEGGLRNVSQRGDSGQGKTSQGVGYLFTEIGKDVKGSPVYGVLGLSKVVFQPANVDAFELRAGIGAGFSTKIGYKK